MNLALSTPTHSPSLQVLSSLPGRARWSLPELQGRSWLARALADDLAHHPHVQSVKANSVLGTLLLRFGMEFPEVEAETWVLAALERAPEEAPEGFADESRRYPGKAMALLRRRRSDEEDEAGPSPLARFLSATGEYPDLQRKAAAATVLDGLANGVPPLLVGLAVGAVANPSTSLIARLGFATLRSRIAAIGLLSGGFWALASVLEYYRERTASELADRVRRDLRVELYEHLQTMDVAALEARDSHNWLAVLDNDVEEVHRFLRHGGKPLVAIVSNILIVGGTFVVVSPALGLVQLLIIPPIFLVSSRMLRPLRARMIQARDVAEELSAMMGGNLAGMGTLASFGAEEDQAQRVRAANEVHLGLSRDANALEAAYVPTLRGIVGAGFVTTVTWGTAKVFAGKMSVAGLDTMAYGQLRLMSALARGGTGMEEFQRTSAALERIYSTLDTAPTMRGGTATLPASGVKGEVVFQEVSFGYDPRNPVLNSVTLRCPAGSTMGIVGASGTGKSTLLKLLMRFHDPQAGAVFIDGQDIRELELTNLRRSLAVVPQEITLFSGTVRENLALGNPGASLEEVQEAARKAEAHDFIESLPHGYDTQLGFGGLSLSGGQRQRIAIARALLVDRPFLLFDEATSALDHATEAAIQRSLAQVTEGRTTLIVAHRLSTIRHADLIVVMDEGRVVEQGTHEELLATPGAYAGMWKIQTGDTRAPSQRQRGKRG